MHMHNANRLPFFKTIAAHEEKTKYKNLFLKSLFDNKNILFLGFCTKNNGQMEPKEDGYKIKKKIAECSFLRSCYSKISCMILGYKQ